MDRICHHHLDGNHDNDDPSNIMLLCNRCHLRRHHAGKVSSEVILDDEIREQYVSELNELNKEYLDKQEKIQESLVSLEHKYDKKMTKLGNWYGLTEDWIPIYSYPKPIWELSLYSYLKPEGKE